MNKLPLNWWPSPAKLNLFLHINGRYENGYHQLQSLFQILDYGDELAFDINSSDKITLGDPIAGVADVDNLIIKAALLLKETALKQSTPDILSQGLGCHIHLRKCLPMGGGIGGGSSNAATTLLVLNKLWDCHLSDTKLATLGLTLGADVPIFIQGKTAFAEGVGEKLEPVSLPAKTYLVLFPDSHVSTAEIFSLPNLPRNTAKINFSDYSFANTHNDCQELVCERDPNVAKALHWLLEYAPSRMTGTGSCVFAMFDHRQEALNVQALLPKGSTSFVANGVNTSLLHSQIQAQVY
ncbi:4-(cytidine 5'-diphospho)-2-C-methyl-D-erythritol kinase [Paraglaciecola sp. MB-3u-78]|uniref:4-(cytidine 5'-diphospho)-2-C-methyl-D-erythritol kinase n=1 Tax=Paraglaciecola sp. MB-3u-78 TaxID=2058332 RepID=UPI000C34BC26|nr:4-(cytidine 5'-diphospho)-2-C-methyl-D-erythritol kinase [Paraglaciecola sp. MB-3u-78]PKG99175.1 4-(cytidine 5'-diphospho)-2-C-methyl-D-erythritol kinase [Paraglaciecola sp. MB-3u-78]